MTLNENSIWRVSVDPGVLKAISRFPRKDEERIRIAVASFVIDPYAGDAQKLGGEEKTWRRRIGSYRIFYEISTTNRVVEVFHVERRGSKTY